MTYCDRCRLRCCLRQLDLAIVDLSNLFEAVIDYSSHHRYSYSECVHFPIAIVLQRLVGPRCETSPTGNPADKGIAGRLHTGDVTNDMPRAPRTLAMNLHGIKSHLAMNLYTRRN
jgi:hypothetical protein